MTKIDWDNIEQYRSAIEEAKAQGKPDRTIQAELGISSPTFYRIKNMLKIAPSKFASKNENKERQRGYDAKSKLKKKQKMQGIDYQPVMAAPVKSDQPIFCLVVGFESKEAAFRALGQI